MPKKQKIQSTGPEVEPLAERKKTILEINPHQSKTAWFIIALVLVVAVFAVMIFIVKENERFFDEVEGGFVQEHGRFTSKVLKDIRNTVDSMEFQIKNGGPIDWVNADSLFGNFGYHFDYPKGWHIAASTTDERFVAIDTKPIMLAERGGQPGSILFWDADGIGYNNAMTLEEILTVERDAFTNLEETTFKTVSGLTIYKLSGEREVLGNPVILSSYYIERPEIELVVPEPEPPRLLLATDTILIEDNEEYIPILEQMLRTVSVDTPVKEKTSEEEAMEEKMEESSDDEIVEEES